MNIQKIIYDEYFYYNDKRKPSINPSKEQPYSEIEVLNLIDIIVRKCNSEIANHYFKERSLCKP